MDACVCVSVSVSVRVRARARDTVCLGARAADTDHAVLNLQRKSRSWERGCKVEAGRQLRSRGRVMAGRCSASRDWGTPRGPGLP